MSIYTIENKFRSKNRKKFISWIRRKEFIRYNYACPECTNQMKESRSKLHREGLCWRCINKTCKFYRKRISIRVGSFFEGINLEIKTILCVVLHWSNNQSLTEMKNYFKLDVKTIRKIIEKLKKYIYKKYPSDHIMGGEGRVVQIDETMLNYKCKSHRGRSPSNKTEALCIVETKNGKITKGFATVIPNKKTTTILPIIQEKVLPGSIIHTDEHKSYKCLNKNNYRHESVCHRRNFVDPISHVNSQAVESFNSLIKYEIKKQKGVQTNKRDMFLKEFCWKFNNKKEKIKKILNSIKMR